MGDVYVAVSGARVGGPGWVRQVTPGERVSIDDFRNSWLVVTSPASWRREGARDRWLRCIRAFTIRTVPPTGCRVGDVLHEGDFRVRWGGRERFEELPREEWPAEK